MRVVFCLFLTLCFSPVFAQKNWEIDWGFGFRPTFSHRFAKVPPTISSLARDEKPLPSFSTGLFSRLKISEKLKLRLGAGVSRLGYQIKTKDFVFEMPEPIAPKNFQNQYVQYNLDIPIDFLRTWKKRRREFYFFGGMAVESTVGYFSKVVVNYFNGDRVVNHQQILSDNWRAANLALRTGFGWEFDFKKLSVFAQPDAQFSIFTQQKSNNIKRRLYSIGLNCGVVFGKN